MAITLLNSAEGLVPGVTVTAAASAGLPQDSKFDAVGLDSGANIVADTAHAAHGAQSFKFTSSSAGQDEFYLMWSSSLGGPLPKVYFREYVFLTSRPTRNWRLIKFLDSDGDHNVASVNVNDDGLLQFWNASDDTVFTLGTIIPVNAWWRIEGFVVGSPTAGQVSLSLFTSMDATSPHEIKTSSTSVNTHDKIGSIAFGETNIGISSLTYWADSFGVSTAGALGPVQPSDGDTGTFTEGIEKIIGTLHMPDGDTGHFTDANIGPASGTGPVSDSDSMTASDLGIAPAINKLLPMSLPGPLGLLTAASAPVAGNGWEVQVRSHTDFHTLLAVIPKYTALSSVTQLKDKGSGSISIPMWDKASAGLWPTPMPSTLSGSNPDFAGGSLAGWNGWHGTITAVQNLPAGGPRQWACQFVPDGLGGGHSPSLEGTSFPIIPGQGYTVTAWVLSPNGYNGVIIGVDWQTASKGYLSTTTTSFNVPAGVWTKITAQLSPPSAAAVFAYPRVGLLGNPLATDVLDIEDVTITYDSGATCLGDLLLDYEHLWQVLWNGKVVGEFLGETIDEKQADGSEQPVVTVAGPGTVTTLGWGRAMPPGFPTIVFKTDAIQDGFAEINTAGQLTLDSNIWNLTSPAADVTLNPSGTCRIAATTGTTYLGGGPYDITSSVISAQFSPITGDGLDGSQLTQFYVQSTTDPGSYAMIALSATAFYCQVGDATAGTVSTKQLTSYDASSDLYWRISEANGVFYFWTSSDGQNWVQQWSSAYTWDATKINLYVAASYDVDGAVAASITNLNGDVVTPTSAGNVFFGQPIMSVWYQLFKACQARGTVPFITTRMNGTHDSFSNAWSDSVSVQIQNGTDLYSLLQSHAAIVNADWVMRPGFNLQVGLPVQSANAVSLGVDRSREIVFHESNEVTTKERTRARDQVANMVGAVNSDGTVVSATDSVSIARYGQREGWVQTATAVNPESMNIVVAASLDQTKDEVLTQTLQVLADKPGRVVFEDYDVGDWVGVERPRGASVIDAVRVVGIAIGIDASGAVTCELTLNTYRQWLGEQLQYLVNKFGGQFINSLGTTPVTSTSSSPTGSPTVVSPSLGGLSNVSLS